MIWLKVLHIMAIASWGGLLLYLPAVVASNVHPRTHLAHELKNEAFGRYLFTLAATPAALVAIISGTLLFLLDRNIAAWMFAKLFAVCGLVFCHAACGWLVLRSEQEPARARPAVTFAVAATAPLFILLILWLVLARPI
ncbi:MAG: CopD family protein [Spongiibacteraceae bacterium]|jgi:uncharacterized membrane protein|nr:CopD family protein [Spongiibacteraceae bacterium]